MPPAPPSILSCWCPADVSCLERGARLPAVGGHPHKPGPAQAPRKCLLSCDVNEQRVLPVISYSSPSCPVSRGKEGATEERTRPICAWAWTVPQGPSLYQPKENGGRISRQEPNKVRLHAASLSRAHKGQRLLPGSTHKGTQVQRLPGVSRRQCHLPTRVCSRARPPRGSSNHRPQH